MTDNTLPDIEPSYPVLVRQAHVRLGGRAPLDEVIAEVRRSNPDRWERQAITAMRHATRSALTEHDGDGMPHASSVGDEYVQRRLFTADDYQSTIDRYVRQSRDLLATAQRLADECSERYGFRPFVPGDSSGPEAVSA